MADWIPVSPLSRRHHLNGDKRIKKHKLLRRGKTADKEIRYWVQSNSCKGWLSEEHLANTTCAPKALCEEGLVQGSPGAAACTSEELAPIPSGHWATTLSSFVKPKVPNGVRRGAPALNCKHFVIQRVWGIRIVPFNIQYVYNSKGILKPFPPVFCLWPMGNIC